MSKLENYHEEFTPDTILQAIPREVSDYVHTDIFNDVQTTDREKGLGIFIRDNMTIEGDAGLSMAVICEWHADKKTGKKIPKFLKYHIYKGIIPDAVLDDINIINEKTGNPVWKK